MLLTDDDNGGDDGVHDTAVNELLASFEDDNEKKKKKTDKKREQNLVGVATANDSIQAQMNPMLIPSMMMFTVSMRNENEIRKPYDS